MGSISNKGQRWEIIVNWSWKLGDSGTHLEKGTHLFSSDFHVDFHYFSVNNPLKPTINKNIIILDGTSYKKFSGIKRQSCKILYNSAYVFLESGSTQSSLYWAENVFNKEHQSYYPHGDFPHWELNLGHRGKKQGPEPLNHEQLAPYSHLWTKVNNVCVLQYICFHKSSLLLHHISKWNIYFYYKFVTCPKINSQKVNGVVMWALCSLGCNWFNQETSFGFCYTNYAWFDQRCAQASSRQEDHFYNNIIILRHCWSCCITDWKHIFSCKINIMIMISLLLFKYSFEVL